MVEVKGFKEGLEDVVAADSAICYIDGTKGILSYRGIDIHDLAENSTFVIERYRAATISLDYFGDSIINSLSDITCCATGFVIAYKLKFWKALALFLATETVLIFTIRDSLLINIVMLIYPIEAIKHWQMAGQ